MNSTKTMTTAQYRNMAADAAQSRNWSEAARLYRLAVQHYPTAVGQLAERDKMLMNQRAASYEAMAASA